MIRDGIYYALAMLAAAGLVAWLAGVWYCVPLLLLAAFFLWFFRDPERAIPAEPGAIVSPADGKVTLVSTVMHDGQPAPHLSIFLNVFDVHVNRAPIAGVVREVEYRRGHFRNAMGAGSAVENEQNIVTLQSNEASGQRVQFKQIAGLLARRIVFTPRPGDKLARGQRVGMIKFGSRVDVIFPPGTEIAVKVGDHVRGGASVIAHAPASEPASEAPPTAKFSSKPSPQSSSKPGSEPSSLRSIELGSEFSSRPGARS